MGGTVRELLILVASVGIIIGGYLGFKSQLTANHIPSPSQTVSKKNQQSLGVSKHESTNHRRHEQKRIARPSKRAAGEVTESDQLPHLYQTEDESESVSAVEETEDLASSEQSAAPTVIAGVPVAAWVKENRGKLKEAQVTAPTQQNLRLFLGCLELKKEASGTDKYTCEKILAAKDSKIANERERY